MRQTFLGKQAGHLHVIFFNRTILGTLKKLMSAPKRKPGFHFFCPLEKKTEQSNYTMLWKISNLILNRFQIPSEPDPPRSLPRIEGGGRGSQKGGTIFLGCISFQTYQRKSFRSLCNSHCHASESRPPSITPWAIL